MIHAQRRNTTRILAAAAAAGLAAFSCIPAPALTLAPPVCSVVPELSAQAYCYEHDAILGTSMELIVRAPSLSDACACESHVLAEIERLRSILSTYDPTSEISLVCGGASVRSPELHELLAAYEQWNQQTAGAINVNMAAVIDLWKLAARHNRVPNHADLAAAAAIRRAWNVDALGKGYIIDRAVAVARQVAPAGLLNIGGDIRAWGNIDWPIGIANPFSPADNAPPLATFILRDGAVATSGGYARYYTIAGHRFSHIIDPRTFLPVTEIVSATATARDCLTANAICAARCVVGNATLPALASNAYLLVSAEGQVTDHGIATSSPSPLAAGAASAPAAAASQPAAWSNDSQVTVNLALKAPSGGRGIKRPYVAVWIENKAGRVVRTLSVWGNQPKWIRELSGWYRASGANQALVQSVTRATRAPGRYSLNWDGLDDAGKPLPSGDYKIVIEINREHGSHVSASTTLACGGDGRLSATVRATAESEESLIEYGPRSR